MQTSKIVGRHCKEYLPLRKETITSSLAYHYFMLSEKALTKSHFSKNTN